MLQYHLINHFTVIKLNRRYYHLFHQVRAMFSILATWLTVLLFILLFALILIMKKMMQVCGREDDTRSLNSSQTSIIPEIFIIHNLGGPGPYEMIDPMDPLYMENLAPPPYQREESRPSQSSQEKPPIYEITFD